VTDAPQPRGMWRLLIGSSGRPSRARIFASEENSAFVFVVSVFLIIFFISKILDDFSFGLLSLKIFFNPLKVKKKYNSNF